MALAEGHSLTEDRNYNFTISDTKGKLKVNQKALTITANDQNITYGESISSAAAAATADGLVNDDALTEITLTADKNDVTASTITAEAAKLTRGEKDVTANYDITYVNGALTIAPKAITVKPQDVNVYEPNSVIPALDLSGVIEQDMALLKEYEPTYLFKDVHGTEVLSDYASTHLGKYTAEWTNVEAMKEALASVIANYTLTTETGAKITVSCEKKDACPLHGFSDTDISKWYHDGVHYCIENGIMKGIGGGKFAPNGTITRAQIAQILYNMAGAPSVSYTGKFSDVAKGKWYTDAIEWGAQNGILAGVGGSKFEPNRAVTRQETAAMLYRYAGSPSAAGTLSSFKDAASASGWAENALVWATQSKIINGRGNGILAPKATAQRCEAATIVMNYCTMP